MKNLPNYLKKVTRIGKILLIFGVPFIFALPFPPPPFNSNQVRAELKNSEPEKQEKFRFITNNNALGATLLSTVLGIKTDSMPGYVCITNTSEVFGEGKKVNKDDLLENQEGGAISIPLILDDTMAQLYVPFASTTCAYPQTINGFAELENKIEVRGFLPYGKAHLSVVNGEPMILVKQYSDLTTIFKMEGKKGYYWKWNVFGKNYVLFLIGWIILLSSAIQVYIWHQSKGINAT